MNTENFPPLARALESLLEELEANRLEVALIPQRVRTNEGGCVRVAISKNARWYRDFCAAYSSSRVRRNAAPDTAIRRENTVRALRSLLAGRSGGKYGPHLVAIAKAAMRRTSAMDTAIKSARRSLDRAACFSA